MVGLLSRDYVKIDILSFAIKGSVSGNTVKGRHQLDCLQTELNQNLFLVYIEQHQVTWGQ